MWFRTFTVTSLRETRRHASTGLSTYEPNHERRSSSHKPCLLLDLSRIFSLFIDAPPSREPGTLAEIFVTSCIVRAYADSARARIRLRARVYVSPIEIVIIVRLIRLSTTIVNRSMPAWSIRLIKLDLKRLEKKENVWSRLYRFFFAADYFMGTRKSRFHGSFFRIRYTRSIDSFRFNLLHSCSRTVTNPSRVERINVV